MIDLVKITATRRRNCHDRADGCRRTELDIRHIIEVSDRIPLEWHEIGRQRQSQQKVKVTLLWEQDVVRFFTSAGTGHGARINKGLRV